MTEHVALASTGPCWEPLGTSHRVGIPLSHPHSPRGRCYSCPYFMEEETEARLAQWPAWGPELAPEEHFALSRCPGWRPSGRAEFWEQSRAYLAGQVQGQVTLQLG